MCSLLWLFVVGGDMGLFLMLYCVVVCVRALLVVVACMCDC